MFLIMLASVFYTGLFLIASAIDPPSDCRFLNPIRDPSAESSLLDFYNKNEPFTFKETNFFQPQCLLCENLGGEVCFGYKGGASYGITSGTINTIRLITNLPYIYSLGENVGKLYTTVYAVAALREDLVIPYRTLLRFKGVTTMDPVVNLKTVALRLCIVCLPSDTSEHTLIVTGGLYNLNVRLFVNEIAVNASNGIILDGNRRARINCRNRNVTIESNGVVPDESTCSTGSCLGPEFCLTYQPEYAITRETWCPLTENNWISTPDNSLKLSLSDSSLPLHIQMERNLLYEKPFALLLNPNWFIDYTGVLTLSIPEATPGYYPDPVWKIVLPSTGQQPLNRRIILMHNCTDIRIRYDASDSDYFQTTIVFVDMKSNSTFTVKDNLDEAKRLCNPEILVAIGNSISTTSQPQPQTTTSNGGSISSSTSSKTTGFGQLIQSFAVTIFFYMLFLSFFLL